MPLAKIHLRPGVTAELTPTLNTGGWSFSNLIRFFSGQVQKLGGWLRVPALDPIVGTCRGLFGWADLVGTPHLAIGTDQRLAVVTGGVLSDVTPIVHTTNAAPALATTAGSSIVTITDATYHPAAGDWINIVTWTTRGGLAIWGYFQVTVATGTSYTIDVSPAVATSTTTSGGAVAVYSTTNASSAVSVALTAHGLTAGQVYTESISTTVGGVIIFGDYVVTSITDAGHFVIPAATLAATTTTGAENAGNMQLLYLLPTGASIAQAIGGWGTSTWSDGPWGTTTAGSTTALIVNARTWSLDHFGQDLVASPDLGAIYHWSPSAPTTPGSVLSSGAPIINRVVFAIAQVQIIMSCGSEVFGAHVPTLIRWCDSGDFTAWVASATNQAGSFQLPTGSYVTAAISMGLGALIWTDDSVYAVTYQGLPFVFGFNRIGVSCEALSKKAPAVIGNLVVWPSGKSFFRYDGGTVQPMECPVYDQFYGLLDPAQAKTVFSAVNSLFNEVSWFFITTLGSVSYVKWNYLENVWDYGALTRTAWTDHSPYGLPMGTDNTGLLLTHESGNDADGAPMQSYAQSGYYDLADGDAITYVNTIIPDFLTTGSPSVNITLYAVDYPGDTPRTYGPFTVTQSSRRINCSIRGRQVALRVGSSELGGFWRMGAVRFNPKPAGSRP